MRDLVACTLGMRRLGISAYCYSSYQFPVPTLTGSIRDDIVFIDPIVGVGELALSDHRSSQLTLAEFLRVASDAYAAGLMSGKAGVLHAHMGDGERQFDLIEQALDTAEIPARVYHPTHINRQTTLFEQLSVCQRADNRGSHRIPDAGDGYRASEAVDRWLAAGLDVERLTCSSDGGGCLQHSMVMGNCSTWISGARTSSTRLSANSSRWVTNRSEYSGFYATCPGSEDA